MPQLSPPLPAAAPGLTGSFAGRELVVQIRRLLVVTLVTCLVYAGFTRASRSFCPGGFDADGGFIDGNGQPTDLAPECLSLQMGPSPVVFIAVAAIVLLTLGRVIRVADGLESATRMLRRAALAIMIVAGLSLVIAQVWFALLPVAEWDPEAGYFFLFPFPFAGVEVTITPLTP
ncbi:hypothetical protein QSU92_11905 [Microbacterium sp. ET2]|uniref:hypothetical protein n=1 Tax=Microbacterium albipurpureum TaxID=3050384 RepID=UPI00259CF7D1|nr:hypothetical protein [Microbacterium sp. ET2 (Ac-2212)]WJL94670.1 hypothetical protein QSU92_11905 [Microbacterium sp. ET2 (Ac-2212)]